MSIPERNQVDSQRLQFGRGFCGHLKSVFPRLCNTTRQVDAKSVNKIEFVIKWLLLFKIIEMYCF